VAAADLDAVRAHLGDCQRCGLCEARRNIVFGVGDPAARLFVIGEGPGAHEDRQGEPFVGKAGQMLDRMLEAVLGLQREQVYISNVVKCRPPGNRNPNPEEIARCRPFLDAQLRVVKPDLVLVLGSVAFKTVFGTSAGIKRSRGAWRELTWEGGAARAMSTFHPAYLLRQPDDKRLTFADLKELRGALDALPPRP
jgi:DNA polymerase